MNEGQRKVVTCECGANVDAANVAAMTWHRPGGEGALGERPCRSLSPRQWERLCRIVAESGGPAGTDRPAEEVLLSKGLVSPVGINRGRALVPTDEGRDLVSKYYGQ